MPASWWSQGSCVCGLLRIWQWRASLSWRRGGPHSLLFLRKLEQRLLLQHQDCRTAQEEAFSDKLETQVPVTEEKVLIAPSLPHSPNPLPPSTVTHLPWSSPRGSPETHPHKGEEEAGVSISRCRPVWLWERMTTESLGSRESQPVCLLTGSSRDQ